jgi:hypothetical protein
MRAAFLMIFASFLAASCASRPDLSLVGSYYSRQLCSGGKDFDLTLKEDGSYRLISILPEGAGPDLGDGVRAGFEELGRWYFDGAIVKLVCRADKKTTKLQASRHDGVLVLSDGELFGLKFEKQRANQVSEPTAINPPPSATSPAPLAHL